MKKIIMFIFAMIVSFIPGIIGVMFTPTGMSDAWYNAINKSVLTPEGIVFAIAWTVLYALLGIALFLVMNNGRTRYSKGKPYALFAAQMILNALWTYLFFGLHMVGWALAVLIALIIVAIWMSRAFFPISRGASFLVWPYIIWMIFALYLNAVIFYLN